MNDKDLEINNRLNENPNATWKDVVGAIWDWKLTFILFLFLFIPPLLLLSGVIDLPHIVLGETELVVITSAIGSLALGGWFVVLPMLKLTSVPIQYLFKINVETNEILDFWVGSPRKMGQVNVVEGSAYQSDEIGSSVYFVEDFDPDTMEAIGPWAGEVNDAEMWTERERIDENRARNNKWTQIGKVLYARFPSMISSIENRYHNKMTDRRLKNTTNHPDIVESEVVNRAENVVESIESPNSMGKEKLLEQAKKDVEETAGVDVPDDGPSITEGDN